MELEMSIQRDNLIAYFERQIAFQRQLIELTQAVPMKEMPPASMLDEMRKESMRFLKNFHVLAKQQQDEAHTIITQLKENRVDPSRIVMYQTTCEMQQKHLNIIYREGITPLNFEDVPSDILNFNNDSARPPLTWKGWTIKDDWVWKALLAEEGARPSDTPPAVDTSTQDPLAIELLQTLTEDDWRFLDELIKNDVLINAPPLDTLAQDPLAAKLPESLTDDDWSFLDKVNESDFRDMYIKETTSNMTSPPNTQKPQPEDTKTNTARARKPIIPKNSHTPPASTSTMTTSINRLTTDPFSSATSASNSTRGESVATQKLTTDRSKSEIITEEEYQLVVNAINFLISKKAKSNNKLQYPDNLRLCHLLGIKIKKEKASHGDKQELTAHEYLALQNLKLASKSDYHLSNSTYSSNPEVKTPAHPPSVKASTNYFFPEQVSRDRASQDPKTQKQPPTKTKRSHDDPDDGGGPPRAKK